MHINSPCTHFVNPQWLLFRGGIKSLLMAASCARSPLAVAREEEAKLAATSGGQEAATDARSPASDGDGAGEAKVGIDISAETRMQVSVALSHLWDATKQGKEP